MTRLANAIKRLLGRDPEIFYDEFCQAMMWATPEHTERAFRAISRAIEIDTRNIYYRLQRVNFYLLQWRLLGEVGIAYGVNDARRDAEEALRAADSTKNQAAVEDCRRVLADLDRQ